MRLVLTWLVGVPVLVLSMVLARSEFLQSPELEARAEPKSVCLRQGETHDVAMSVSNQGYRLSCDRRTIH